MKELVVISGKGGTGKTSILACFAALATNKVLADCDVDAADLHLVLKPQIQRREVFIGGKKARIRLEDCAACGQCKDICAFEAIHLDGPANDGVGKTYRIDPISCEGCGLCVRFCPAKAIEFKEVRSGEWFISHTRFGPMVHAQLGAAEENSGKLVTLVRTQARQLAQREGLDLMLVDGAPGIGCPVIASIGGADMALIVTEPTLSALHDMERVRELTRHFEIPTLVCINKYDINRDIAAQIEMRAEALDARVVGKVRYDPVFTESQIMRMPMVEYTNRQVADDVRTLWQNVQESLSGARPALTE